MQDLHQFNFIKGFSLLYEMNYLPDKVSYFSLYLAHSGSGLGTFTVPLCLPFIYNNGNMASFCLSLYQICQSGSFSSLFWLLFVWTSITCQSGPFYNHPNLVLKCQTHHIVLSEHLKPETGPFHCHSPQLTVLFVVHGSFTNTNIILIGITKLSQTRWVVY